MDKNGSLTVRMTQKLRYGLDLLARKQRRNLSGVMQWLVVEAVKEADFSLDNLWDVDADNRIKKLAKFEPSLLTYEEEIFMREEE